MRKTKPKPGTVGALLESSKKIAKLPKAVREYGSRVLKAAVDAFEEPRTRKAGSVNGK